MRKALEDAVIAITPDVTFHPTGTIIIRSGSERMIIMPRNNPDGTLWGWTYRTVFSDGSQSVSANTVSHVARVVSKVKQWAWIADRYDRKG